MSEELLKKFYSKVLRLVHSKQDGTSEKVSPETIAAFKNYAEKGGASDILLKLGLNDLHALIEALKGDKNQTISEENVKTSPIFFEYLSSLLPLLSYNLSELEQHAIPHPARKIITCIQEQMQLLQKMITGVQEENIAPIMNGLIQVYPSQPPALKRLVSDTLKKLGRPVVLALIQSLYQEGSEKHSDLPELLKEMGYLAVQIGRASCRERV